MKNSHRHLHQPSPIFTGGQKVGKLCPDFQPHSHFENSGFKMKQYIENLKKCTGWADDRAKESPRQCAYPSLYFFRGQKNKFCPILPFRGSGLQTEQQIKNLKYSFITMRYGLWRHSDTVQLGPQLQHPRSITGQLKLGILPTQWSEVGSWPCLRYLLRLLANPSPILTVG